MKRSTNWSRQKSKREFFLNFYVDFFCQLRQKKLILLLNSVLNGSKRVLILLISLFFSDIIAYSQFNSLDMLSAVLDWERANPSLVASNKRTNVLGEFQSQWVGFEGHPQDVFFSFNSHLPCQRDQAVGVVFSVQSESFWKFQRLGLEYAHRIETKTGNLSFGLDVGFADFSFDYDKASSGLGGEDNYHKLQDPLLSKEGASEEQNDIVFDLNFGVGAKINKFDVGVSVFHLNAGKAEIVEGKQFALEPTMLVYGEYKLKTRSKMFLYRPSLMVRTNFSSMQVGMNNVCTYKEKFTFALNSWFWSSMAFAFSFEVISGMQIGYGYVLPLNKMIRSGGSHDVVVRYSFDLNFSKKDKYKSERIL